MTNFAKLALFAAAAIFLAARYGPTENSPAEPPVVEVAGALANELPPHLEIAPTSPPDVFKTVASPFGRRPAPSPPTLEQRKSRTKQALDKAGLHTPERYYDLGLKSLRALAERGDIYAALQLGTQYLFLNEAIEYDPDYDFSKNPTQEAAKYFTKTALMGSSSSMLMLATKLAPVNPVDGYAWKILAEQLTDEGTREFFQKNQFDFNLSAADMQKALQRSEELKRQLLSAAPITLPPE